MGTLPRHCLLEAHEWSDSIIITEHHHDQAGPNSRVLSSNNLCSRCSRNSTVVPGNKLGWSFQREIRCLSSSARDKTKPPLDPSSSPRIKRLESVSDSPPEMVDPRPGDTTLDPEEPAPTSAVSSSLPSRTPLPPQSNPHGSRPATAAAPALTPPSMDQLCSEERTWTPRVFACSLMMEVTSSDKDFSPTAADPAASSTVKLRRASKH